MQSEKSRTPNVQALLTIYIRACREFYEVNEIGWCSRPKDTSMITIEDKDRGKLSFFERTKKRENPNRFVRKGQFKKESNMNYCLDLSICAEDEFLRLVAARAQEGGRDVEELTLEDEKELNGVPDLSFFHSLLTLHNMSENYSRNLRQRTHRGSYLVIVSFFIF